MKKCYFTKIDDNFDPENDMVLGPWCLPSLKSSKDINFIEPYGKDEILPLHRKLFNLTFFLLNRDIEGRDLAFRKKYSLLLEKDYLFFVFFAFSRYRVLKKLLLIASAEKIIFEDVFHPQNQDTFSLSFGEKGTGYLSAEILKCLVEEKNIRKFQNTNGGPRVKERIILRSFDWSSVKTKIKKRFNYFADLTGVYFFHGVALSFFYNLVNMGRKSACSYLLYEPNINFDEETNEFIKIFDKLSNSFINKGPINLDLKTNVPKLTIKYPSFLFKFNEFGLAVDSMLGLKTKIVISQHGSSYATLQNHFHREMEYSFTSFITWGAKCFSYLNRKNIINYLPSPHLSSLANVYIFKDQKNILWITGCDCKEGDGLEYLYGTEVLRYIKKKIDFYNCIDDYLKDLVIHKALKNVWSDEMQNILGARYVTDGTAIERMYDAKILFLDYYGTPFYEAMSMNVPVVVGFFECEPLFTEDASAIFQKFEDAGVVYRTPEAAAQFVNEMYHKNIKQWWHDEKIQKIRREFLEMYANNKPYFWPWLKAILKREI